MSTSRWLAWAPKGRTIEKALDQEPPKPSKILSDGFEGAPSEPFPFADCSSADRDAARSQIFRWVGARCVRGWGTWGSEKSLWHDYVDWQQKQKLAAVPRQLFGEILNLLFRREMDGWQGIALAINVVVSSYIM